MGALDGIKVLDLSRLLPGPYCSMVLADHGAEVLAIEDRRFAADGLYFGDVFRNKRHMTLNLKKEEGRRIFLRLAREADIILEGFRPGVVDRLGVGYAELAALNPGVIYCSISGYGQHGDARDRPGHDVNYISRAGILDTIGARDGAPVIPGVQMADIAGGGMNAVIGILLALHERSRSGKGQYIDISMTDGILGLLTLPYFLEKQTGQRQRRSQSLLSHRYACYNTYATADGRHVALGAVEERFWRNLCRILGLEPYAGLQYDEDRREEIIDALRTLFRSQPLAHWEKVLGGADVCYSKIQHIDEVLEDRLFQERGMIIEQPGRQGVERCFGIPIKLSRTPGAMRRAAPPFGGSTREVLAELGYSAERIQSLYDTGVV